MRNIPSNPYLSQVIKKIREQRPQLSRENSFIVEYESRSRGLFAQVWFMTGGCSWDAQGSCTMCDYGKGPSISGQAMVGAVREALQHTRPESAYLEVAPSGSMFDIKEVPLQARREIFQLMNAFPSEVMVTESRAETITTKMAEELKAFFPTKPVAICLGLESADPWIQRYCVNKISHPQKFIDATEILHAAGINTIANISVGTAFLNVDEVIEDAVATTRWALNNGADSALLFPLQVKKYTALAALHELGLYRAHCLWLMVEVLYQLGEELMPRVDLAWWRRKFDAQTFDLPRTCEKCYERVLAGLDDLAESHSWETVLALHNLKCECKDIWQSSRGQQTTSLAERVIHSYEALADHLELRQLWERHSDNLRKSILEIEPKDSDGFSQLSIIDA